ncbi:MAG: phytanoyl-CoA dioxygenase family protein [Planctomycetales bacterium]|nr:phytanoyl-CoA dioxygenase family protein [Planctomycetales bacterium]
MAQPDPPSETPRFAIIPTADELAQLNRELRFFPTDNPSPETLSVEQLAAFNRDGCLFPLEVFTTAEITEHREYFDRLLAETLAAGGDPYSISSAHLRYEPVRDLLTDARIVGYVRDLLGPDVVGWGSHYFCKLPGDAKQVSWHQDASYWPLTPSKTVTVWLAIDDADEENACMKVIPGTHRRGLIEYQTSEQDERNVLNQTVADPTRFGAPRSVILKAGQVSIHSDLLLHGSEANRSSRRRCGLTLRYCAADVVAHLGWSAKGVLVAGSAPHHWPS